MSQPVVSGRWVSVASHQPLANCSTTAGAVKIASAITTNRATPAMTRTSPLRCAIHMKKAMPPPVPSSTVAPIRCSMRRLK